VPSHSGGDPYLNKELQAPNTQEATKTTMQRRAVPPRHPNSIAKTALSILALFTRLLTGPRLIRLAETLCNTTTCSDGRWVLDRGYLEFLTS
jgi:hypothetical protein